MKNITQIPRQSLRAQVYDRLRSAIIHLELKPGERINDKALAEQFGVSRTPVREALKKLEDEGLIVTSPGSETVVSLVEVEQAMHAFTVVASLHGLAARLALTTLTLTHADQMTAINNEFAEALKVEDKYRAIQMDDQFHAVIIEASHNPEIMLALDRLLPKIRRLELQKFNTFDGKKSIKQHQEIISCISNDSKEQLPALIENNWLSLAEYLTEK
ncbi:GntR family transcriptional regulator [Niallia sp. Sow4_A1]|jgi:DNA-binding GntR family transcriptional regulator|uniref:GntR family transcriptional regulator n=1 Tax=Niallia hominis TaxID=3133173 RepID=A0ABV1F4L4_9BACI|nr:MULTISPECIES: GntR family transcriptional regulator [Bacillaceae]MCF2647062.1 GntR family transcriptional regulator [Niallia circulans]MCM3363928.1 GntR family transcriptional regulator [Niallia sp. MER TA 168]CAI9392907.1 HTH-type transcriptional repressor RspR [Bacillus sp. T2.9-1]